MSIKLVSTGGGSVTIQEPNTASDFTLSVPARTGTTVLQDGSNNLLMNSGYGSDAVAYGCRAWVNFNGTGTVAIRASGNVSSITDNGIGNYQINFTTAMPDSNYAVATFYTNEAPAALAYPTFGGPAGTGVSRSTYQQAGSFRIFFTEPSSYTNSIDKETVTAMAVR